MAPPASPVIHHHNIAVREHLVPLLVERAHRPREPPAKRKNLHPRSDLDKRRDRVRPLRWLSHASTTSSVNHPTASPLSALICSISMPTTCLSFAKIWASSRPSTAAFSAWT